jgi:predicted Rossmann fold nucleotide-binding protein DprA/Smf involved in DNA uptake
MKPDNQEFAAEVGRQAARQGFVLVSGNARGADRTAQDACLAEGGAVISVVADGLVDKQPHDRILYLSEDGFDESFSAQRALHRNHVIHALGEKVLVAQSSLRTGGTWDGTAKNLRFGWSDVYCYQDGSEAANTLIQMGAEPVTVAQLEDLQRLPGKISLF